MDNWLCIESLSLRGFWHFVCLCRLVCQKQVVIPDYGRLHEDNYGLLF